MNEPGTGTVKDAYYEGNCALACVSLADLDFEVAVCGFHGELDAHVRDGVSRLSEVFQRDRVRRVLFLCNEDTTDGKHGVNGWNELVENVLSTPCYVEAVLDVGDVPGQFCDSVLELFFNFQDDDFFELWKTEGLSDIVCHREAEGPVSDDDGVAQKVGLVYFLVSFFLFYFLYCVAGKFALYAHVVYLHVIGRGS